MFGPFDWYSHERADQGYECWPKLVTLTGGSVLLVHADVTEEQFFDWFDTHIGGLPKISGGVQISFEIYERYEGMFADNARLIEP